MLTVLILLSFIVMLSNSNLITMKQRLIAIVVSIGTGASLFGAMLLTKRR